MRTPKLLALSLTVAAFAIGVAAPAWSAEVTEVADAIDGDDPIDINFGVRLMYTYQRALISRENTQSVDGGPPRSVLVRELDYSRHTAKIAPRLEIGMFHDLSVFVEVPFTLWDQQFYGYSAGTDQSNSTLARDMANPPKVTEWDEPGQEFGSPGVEREQGHNDWRMDPANGGRYERARLGFDFPRFGLRFSPLNQDRDTTKPTITLQADYKLANIGFLPIPVMLDENEPTDGVSFFAADGTHVAHASVAMSKKFFIVDPYFVLDYNFPFAASDAQLGLEPRHDVGFWVGTEVVPYENAELDQKLAVDVSFLARYFSPGRDYNEVSDMLGELTLSDEFARLGANLKLYFRAWKFIYFDVTGGISYDTPHFLTTEPVGCDGGCPDPGLAPRLISLVDNRPRDGVVRLERDQGERNPYFNPIYDAPGRRLKAEENFRASLMAHVAVTF